MARLFLPQSVYKEVVMDGAFAFPLYIRPIEAVVGCQLRTPLIAVATQDGTRRIANPASRVDISLEGKG